MPAVFALFFVMLMSLYGALNASKQEAVTTAAVADTQATNVLAYKSSVVTYLNANPNATGAISDASLVMPTGLVRNPNWTNVVANGTLFIYEVTPTTQPGVLDSIYLKSGKSFLVGRSNGSFLVNPFGYATGTPIPVTAPVIPVGAIVLVGK